MIDRDHTDEGDKSPKGAADSGHDDPMEQFDAGFQALLDEVDLEQESREQGESSLPEPDMSALLDEERDEANSSLHSALQDDEAAEVTEAQGEQVPDDIPETSMEMEEPDDTGSEIGVSDTLPGSGSMNIGGVAMEESESPDAAVELGEPDDIASDIEAVDTLTESEDMDIAEEAMEESVSPDTGELSAMVEDESGIEAAVADPDEPVVEEDGDIPAAESELFDHEEPESEPEVSQGLFGASSTDEEEENISGWDEEEEDTASPSATAATTADASSGLDDEEDEEEAYGAGTSWLDDIPQGGEDTVDIGGYDDDGDDDEEYGQQEKPGRSKLPLLLGLLVVVAGGGAYLYFTGGKPAAQKPAPFMAPKHVAAPKHEAAVPVPNRPETQPAQAMQPAAPAAEPSATSPQQTAAASAPAAQETAPATPTGNAGSQPAQMASQTPATPPATPAPETAPQPQPAATAAQPEAVAVAQAPYTLQGGVFVLRSGLKRMESRVRKLGFDPQVTDTQRLLPMTRLRVGEFPVEIASGKLQQVKKIAPHGAFALRKGEQVTIYAGSYFYAAAARREAARLAAKGLPVKEETAKVMMPVHILHFGAFADRASAEAKLSEVKAAGIKAVVKKSAAEANKTAK